MYACAAATAHAATLASSAAAGSGQSVLKISDSTSSGNTINAWYSRLVMTLSRPAGRGV